MGSGVAAWIASREARIALALAVFAGLRVAIYSLAFPFFTNVDESRHLDVDDVLYSLSTERADEATRLLDMGCFEP